MLYLKLRYILLGIFLAPRYAFSFTTFHSSHYSCLQISTAGAVLGGYFTPRVLDASPSLEKENVIHRMQYNIVL